MQFFSKIFISQTRSITTAALLIGGMGLVSRLLGVVRVRIFADIFGASADLDMFYAAFRLPDLLFNIMIMGAITSAFIPIFTEYRVSKRDYWRLASVTLTMFTLSLAIMAVVLMIFASQLIEIVAPGFDPQQKQFTVMLTRIMLIQPILLGLSNIFSGILQSLKRFVAYATAPVMYNIGIIIGALTLAKTYGVIGLAGAVLMGASLHLLIQLPALKGSGFSFQLVWSLTDKGFRRIIRLMLPRSLGLATIQINILVITAIASTLAEGSVSIFNFANDVQYVPLGIIGIAYAVATFPSLTEKAARQQRRAFVKSLIKSTREVVFLTLPLALIFFFLREEIVNTIFSTQKCGAVCLSLTQASLALFSVSIIFQGLIPLFSKAFFALKDTLTPVILNLISIAINIASALILVKLIRTSSSFRSFFELLDGVGSAESLAVLALPLAFSAAATINLGLLGIALKVKLGKGLVQRSTARALAKMVLAGAMLVVVAILVKSSLEPFFDTSQPLLAFGLGSIAGIAGLSAYWITTILLKLREGEELLKKIKNPKMAFK